MCGTFQWRVILFIFVWFVLKRFVSTKLVFQSGCCNYDAQILPEFCSGHHCKPLCTCVVRFNGASSFLILYDLSLNASFLQLVCQKRCCNYDAHSLPELRSVHYYKPLGTYVEVSLTRHLFQFGQNEFHADPVIKQNFFLTFFFAADGIDFIQITLLQLTHKKE